MQGVWVPSLVRKLRSLMAQPKTNNQPTRPQRTFPQQTSRLESEASSWDQPMLLGKQTSHLPCWSCHLICHFRLRCSLDIWKQRGAPLFREHLPSFLVVWPQFRWSSPSGDTAVSSVGVDCDGPLGILWCWVGPNGRERCSEGCSLTKTLGHCLLHRDPFGDDCLINALKNFPGILAKSHQLTRPQFSHLSNGITTLALASCWSSTPALKLSCLGDFDFTCGAFLSSVHTDGSTPSLRSWLKSHLLREICLK